MVPNFNISTKGTERSHIDFESPKFGTQLDLPTAGVTSNYCELNTEMEDKDELLSNKMRSVSTHHIKMSKNFNKDMRSTSRDNARSFPTELNAHNDKNMEINPGSTSPGNKLDYDRKNMDEAYARGIFKIPKNSKVWSPSKNAKNDRIESFEGEEYVSFGSGTLNLENPKTEKRKRTAVQNTPKTEADSYYRSNSFLSCGNYNTASSLNVPKKPKIDKKMIKTQSESFIFYT